MMQRETDSPHEISLGEDARERVAFLLETKLSALYEPTKENPLGYQVDVVREPSRRQPEEPVAKLHRGHVNIIPYGELGNETLNIQYFAAGRIEQGFDLFLKLSPDRRHIEEVRVHARSRENFYLQLAELVDISSGIFRSEQNNIVVWARPIRSLIDFDVYGNLRNQPNATSENK